MDSEIMNEIFFKDLEYIFVLEKLKSKILRKLCKSAHSKNLKKLYDKERIKNKRHISIIKKIFEIGGKVVKNKKSVGAEGLYDEGIQILNKRKKFTPNIFDNLLISYTQRVLNYEIATYNTLMVYARKLGSDKTLNLLQRISFDIKSTYLILTDIMIINFEK